MPSAYTAQHAASKQNHKLAGKNRANNKVSYTVEHSMFHMACDGRIHTVYCAASEKLQIVFSDVYTD